MRRNLSWIMLFLIYTFSYAKDYRADIIKFYPKENPIVNVTSRLDFDISVEIDLYNISENDVFELSSDASESFIKISQGSINSTNGIIQGGGKKVQLKSKDGKPLRKLKLDFKGTLMISWQNSNKKIANIRMGTIKKVDGTTHDNVYISFDSDDITPIRQIKIEVVDDLDLGIAFSGEKLSTKSGGTGRPAKLNVSGSKDKKIKLLIPRNAIIKNNRGDILNVNLEFRENRAQELIKSLTLGERNSSLIEEDTVKIQNIFIDGECLSNSTSIGNYEGSFVVRVEYEE